MDEELPPIQLEQPTYSIGIVTDGNTHWDQKLTTLFKQEIQAMAEDEFIVKFPESMQLSGKDTAKGVKQAVDRLLANPDTSLILTLPWAPLAPVRHSDGKSCQRLWLLPLLSTVLSSKLNKYARQLSNEHTMPVNIVDVGNSAQETLAAIPAGTDAVMEKGSDLFTIFFGRHCSLFENRIPSL